MQKFTMPNSATGLDSLRAEYLRLFFAAVDKVTAHLEKECLQCGWPTPSLCAADWEVKYTPHEDGSRNVAFTYLPAKKCLAEINDSIHMVEVILWRG